MSVSAPECDLPAYRARIVGDVRLDDRAVEFREHGADCWLRWSQVVRVLCAEVGEPEGVRTIVFDLIVEIAGDARVVYRFDAEPGEASGEIAAALVRGLGSGRTEIALCEVAQDGMTKRWFPDIESFEIANVEALAEPRPRS